MGKHSVSQVLRASICELASVSGRNVESRGGSCSHVPFTKQQAKVPTYLNLCMRRRMESTVQSACPSSRRIYDPSHGHVSIDPLRTCREMQPGRGSTALVCPSA